MKGLLLKDLAFLKTQKVFYGLAFAFCIFYSFMLEDASFAIGYVILIFSISTLNSLAYDEHDNGNAFLFTMPFSRTDYVKGKYMFGILMIGAGTLVSSLICGLILFLKTGGWEKEIFITAFVTGILGILIMCVNLPIHIKYGAEKGKIVIILTMIGSFAGIAFIVEKIDDFTGLLQWIHNVPMLAAGAIMIAALVVVIGISMKITIRVIERKEF